MLNSVSTIRGEAQSSYLFVSFSIQCSFCYLPVYCGGTIVPINHKCSGVNCYMLTNLNELQ